MDAKIYHDVLDLSCIHGAVIDEGNGTITNDETILQATYDNAIHRQLAEHFSIQPYSFMPNSNDEDKNDVLQENEYGNNKRFFVLCVTLIMAMLASAVVLVAFYNLNSSQGVSSPKRYPLLNYNLCDTVNPYYYSSWFTPSPTDNFICDDPIQISEIYIEEMKVFTGTSHLNCQSKLDCMALIRRYFEDKNCKFNFFVDFNSNVYQVRGWMCPFLSGQLWIGVIPEYYNPINDSEEVDSEEVERILTHLKNEIVSYAEKCGFFSISGVNYNYKNITYHHGDTKKIIL